MLSAHEGSLPIRKKGINMKQNKLTPKERKKPGGFVLELHKANTEHRYGVIQPPANGILGAIGDNDNISGLWRRFSDDPVHGSTVHHWTSVFEELCLSLFKNHLRNT